MPTLGDEATAAAQGLAGPSALQLQLAVGATPAEDGDLTSCLRQISRLGSHAPRCLSQASPAHLPHRVSRIVELWKAGAAATSLAADADRLQSLSDEIAVAKVRLR